MNHYSLANINDAKNDNTVAVKIIYPFRLLGTCVVRLKRFRFYNVLKALQFTYRC